MNRMLPPSAAEASAYIAGLVAEYPNIREVWLFGSRANGSAKPESDWDFLAFADEATLAALRGDSRFRRDGIDLLIVTDNERFEAPWNNGTHLKSGNLSKDWQWRTVSPTKATYQAAKGDFDPKERSAERVCLRE